MSEHDFFVHPSAYVDEPCQIGAGSKIWHFCHVMAHAQIGERCILGQNVFVANDVVIGNNVKIQNNVSLYTGVELEDDVFCGPSCVFTNVINPRSQMCATASTCARWCDAEPPSAPTPPSSAAPPSAAMPSSPRAQCCAGTCPTMP